ncbi:hypothetical protein EZZ81_17045 [Pseudomonas viridiflava]|uniref:Uncharacterized protein n=1 Tax=Pseudomonas viridiflava TaxID=33069 RepID=A0AA46VXD6_PSEVI|nr:hypothetical protein EZZ81_17045 [Pseudomonas viridiflava]
MNSTLLIPFQPDPQSSPLSLPGTARHGCRTILPYMRVNQAFNCAVCRRNGWHAG